MTDMTGTTGNTGEQHTPAVGAALPELVVEHVDAEKMKTMALLLRDPNPIHWDVESVRSLGMGDRPVNQGPNNMAYLVDLLTRFAGGADRVRALQVRFVANAFAGDRLVAGGRVASVNQADDGECLVECDVWLRRNGAEDDVVMAGTATVAMPAPPDRRA